MSSDEDVIVFKGRGGEEDTVIFQGRAFLRQTQKQSTSSGHDPQSIPTGDTPHESEVAEGCDRAPTYSQGDDADHSASDDQKGAQTRLQVPLQANIRVIGASDDEEHQLRMREAAQTSSPGDNRHLQVTKPKRRESFLSAEDAVAEEESSDIAEAKYAFEAGDDDDGYITDADADKRRQRSGSRRPSRASSKG